MAAAAPLPPQEAVASGPPGGAAAAAAVAGSEAWVCSRCTLENGPSLSFCQACLGRRGGEGAGERELLRRAFLMRQLAMVRRLRPDARSSRSFPSFEERHEAVAGFVADEPRPLGRTGRAALACLGACGGACIGSTVEFVLGTTGFDWGMVLGLLLGFLLGLLAGGCLERRRLRDLEAERRAHLLRPEGPPPPWLDLEAPAGELPRLRMLRSLRPGSGISELLMRMQLNSLEGDEPRAPPESRPASLRCIGALPTHKVDAKEVQGAPEEHRSCTICIGDFCEGEVQKTLPCFHRFHAECVDPWLRKNGSCPICKHRIDAEFEA